MYLAVKQDLIMIKLSVSYENKIDQQHTLKAEMFSDLVRHIKATSRS